MLYLPCRHHIMEIMMKYVYETHAEAKTVGPENSFFKRFQNSWKTIDTSKYENGLKDAKVARALSADKLQISNFISHQFTVFNIIFFTYSLIHLLIYIIINKLFNYLFIFFLIQL